MSEWTWVAAGYLVAYGGLAGYLLSLRRRTRRAHRQETDMQRTDPR